MIQELFTEALYLPKLSAETKRAAIEEMVDALDAAGHLRDREAFLKAVLDREAEYSTGIGMGVAIPHGKSAGVKTPGLVFARSEAGVDFESMDEKPAHLLFLVAVSEENADTHLRILSSLSRKLMHQEVRDALMKAANYESVIAVLQA